MQAYLKAQGNRVSLCHRFNFKSEERIYAKREKVTKFTDGSRRRMLKYLRSSVSRYSNIGTLTYPAQFYACDFRNHWRAFVERWRRKYGQNDKASLFWFVEFQKNGQPHYHFYSNHYICYEWLATAWFEICGTGQLEHETAGTSIERIRSGKKGFLKYASKYASKHEQKELPTLYENQAGRWWGVVGNDEIVSASIVVHPDELALFGLSELISNVKRSAERVIFEDFGVTVWQIDDDAVFSKMLWGFKRANKVLLKAEQNERARIYSERRS